jgi:hypothetical protein
MQKILLSLFIFVAVFLGISHGYADNSITTTNFTIDTRVMDPVWAGNHKSSSGSTAVSLSWWKDSLMAVLRSFSDLLLFMIPVIATVSFLVAGYFYIFSAGDSEKSSRGKTIIKWNIIAMLVAFFSYTLVSMIIKLFS